MFEEANNPWCLSWLADDYSTAGAACVTDMHQGLVQAPKQLTVSLVSEPELELGRRTLRNPDPLSVPYVASPTQSEKEVDSSSWNNQGPLSQTLGRATRLEACHTVPFPPTPGNHRDSTSLSADIPGQFSLCFYCSIIAEPHSHYFFWPQRKVSNNQAMQSICKDAKKKKSKF